MKFLYLLLLIVLLSGCKANEATIIKTPSIPSASSAPLKEDVFNKLSESDKKQLQQSSPQEVIKIYYKAIMDRNYNLAKSCLDGSTSLFNSPDTIKFWDAHKSLKNLQIKLPDKLADGSTIAQTDLDVMFEVQYDVVLDNNSYGEGTGSSLYFVGLKRNDSTERWKITVLGTAP